MGGAWTHFWASCQSNPRPLLLQALDCSYHQQDCFRHVTVNEQRLASWHEAAWKLLATILGTVPSTLGQACLDLDYPMRVAAFEQESTTEEENLEQRTLRHSIKSAIPSSFPTASDHNSLGRPWKALPMDGGLSNPCPIRTCTNPRPELALTSCGCSTRTDGTSCDRCS